jgi:hypothetical protein
LDSTSADNVPEFGNVSKIFFVEIGNVSNLVVAHGCPDASHEESDGNASSVRHELATFPPARADECASRIN